MYWTMPIASRMIFPTWVFRQRSMALGYHFSLHFPLVCWFCGLPSARRIMSDLLLRKLPRPGLRAPTQHPTATRCSQTRTHVGSNAFRFEKRIFKQKPNPRPAEYLARLVYDLGRVAFAKVLVSG